MNPYDTSTIGAIASAARSLFLDGQVLITLGRQNYPVLVSFSAGTIPDQEAATNVMVCLSNLNRSPTFQSYLDVSQVSSFQVRVSNSELDSGSIGREIGNVGVISINVTDIKHEYLTPDGAWEHFNLQSIVNHEIMHVVTGLDDGPTHIGATNDINNETQGGAPRFSYEDVRCFLAGTPILMADSSIKCIEFVKVGDIVSSYDAMLNEPCDKFSPRAVTKIFNNITKTVVDLCGLRCTPGHIFLTKSSKLDKDYKFSTISTILKEDGIIVDRNGIELRARTGSITNSERDTLISIVFYSVEESRKISARVRAGIEFCLRGRNYVSLAKQINIFGITIKPSGRLLDVSGVEYEMCDWPEGSTPFDTPEMQNWIVEIDGKPYTPPWILALTDTDDTEGLQVVGQDTTASASGSMRQHAL